jgi:hypothetical protein
MLPTPPANLMLSLCFASSTGESRWMQSTPPATYKAGSIIRLKVIVQTNRELAPLMHG